MPYIDAKKRAKVRRWIAGLRGRDQAEKRAANLRADLLGSLKGGGKFGTMDPVLIPDPPDGDDHYNEEDLCSEPNDDELLNGRNLHRRQS